MARGFGPTSGVASTDVITTPLTLDWTGNLRRSWSIFYRLNADNPTSATSGRLWQKSGSVTNDEACFLNGGLTAEPYAVLFNQAFTGAVAQWDTGSNKYPNDTSWHHFAITYDASSTSNNPTLYIDAVPVAFNAPSPAPSGTVVTSTDPYVIGNRSFDLARPMQGHLADFEIYDQVILSPMEIAALSHGIRPNIIRPRSLLAWYPLDGYGHPALDLGPYKKFGTLSGTKFAVGPPQINPGPPPLFRMDHLPKRGPPVVAAAVVPKMVLVNQAVERATRW